MFNIPFVVRQTSADNTGADTIVLCGAVDSDIYNARETEFVILVFHDNLIRLKNYVYRFAGELNRDGVEYGIPLLFIG